MQEFISIKNWQEDDRPREKMMRKGVASLSDAELLAILISSGTRERSALDLGRDVLATAQNNLRELGRLSLAELQQTKGIGEARAITISAALELGRRRQIADGLDRARIASSAAAADILMPLLQDLTMECFYVLYMNINSRLIRYEQLSSGGLSATVADVRIILRNAILNNAPHIIVAHNHPSGNLTPSEYDKIITRKLYEGAAIMDIKLLDHLIIAGNNYLSMKDEGLF
jgi:DNA repair protein RadC